jgi:hypothetical protein
VAFNNSTLSSGLLPAGDALTAVRLVNLVTGQLTPLALTSTAGGVPAVYLPTSLVAALARGQSLKLTVTLQLDSAAAISLAPQTFLDS